MEEDNFKRILNNILIRARTLHVDMLMNDNIISHLDKHKNILNLVKEALEHASIADKILISKSKPRVFTKMFNDFLNEYEKVFFQIDNELKDLLNDENINNR